MSEDEEKKEVLGEFSESRDIKEDETQKDEYPKDMPRCKMCGKPAKWLVRACNAWICDDCFTCTF